MSALGAVHYVLMTRILFFPKRCDPMFYGVLRKVAVHADRYIFERYGEVCQDHLTVYLQRHWKDITKHVGKDARHIRRVY